MRPRTISLLLAVAVTVACCGSDWLHFRGTENRSVSEETGLPKMLGEEEFAWKAPLPGRGPSSPIVVGDQVVVTCSSGVRQDRLHVLALDAATGKLRWERQLWATGSTICNPYGAVANNTPASDGRLIFAFYSSNDVVCFDLEGNLKWLRGLGYDYPAARNEAGMASSPLVVGDVVVVQLENQGESFVSGIDAGTGETRWRLERQPDAVWCSPTVLRGETPEDDVVLLQTRGRFSGHDPHTGEELWHYEADCHTIASCTTCGETIYLPANGLHALRYDPRRRGVELLWYERRLRGNNSSPVVHDGRVYRLKSPGILVCADADAGRVLWQLRLKGPIWATPVVADGHLYAVNHDGLVQVVQLGDKGELVSTRQLDPDMLASPAVGDRAIYFRSDAHLWKFAIRQSR
jgi:outer membrane protein assembly factor BamB